ncbi:SH3 domain-containing protein [Methyloceanibacter sp.]|uniref:SH3 domain-containing protein n=1 Tax=Methyloceanibacter sp. TaxID=1965321 RepID=UPI002D4F5009|nr:SH3 domain-containing protein [Methyloceanibacter sp.]HZP08053.1 SH3 domain-containing protein [Methyloceanibacter sp.]
MRLLLIFAVLVGLIYAGRALIFGGEAEQPASKPGTATAPSEPTQALSADALTPSPQGSPHAIAVEQAAAPAEAKTAAAPPPAEKAPVPSPAEASPAPAPATSTASAEDGANPNGTAAPPDQPAFMRVTAPATIREGPATSAKIVGVAEAGAEAQVLGRSSDWVRIVDPASKKTGWIHESFLAPQAAPQSRPVPPEEMAALAGPESEAAPDYDQQPSFRQKPRRHAYRHRYWRHRLVVGPLILRFGY